MSEDHSTVEGAVSPLTEAEIKQQAVADALRLTSGNSFVTSGQIKVMMMAADMLEQHIAERDEQAAEIKRLRGLEEEFERYIKPQNKGPIEYVTQCQVYIKFILDKHKFTHAVDAYNAAVRATGKESEDVL